ncbi:MAG: hypothetical protein HYX28_02025 [Candidatus Koribacter versatilis]|uniref:Uncharacterized protein n=1 Tax=Candidatus Korobacter versatilis TaxID=658062 RepID=A0A932A6D9_9BACT|nr:hypothetical protein [Candidatus Koribacter versatilis]
MASLLPRENDFVNALLSLTLDPKHAQDACRLVAGLTEEERAEFVALADAHHVVIRALEPVRNCAAGEQNAELERWASAAIGKERRRIENALTRLHAIVGELEAGGCPTVVMKSLEHWPDLGNDLDLYTTAGERKVIRGMVSKFSAHIEARSWGDRLANKWNFAVPGLPEAVEVHAQRLGQTGEHTSLAQRFVSRRQPKTLLGLTFQAPAPEEALIVATLQRMYRHFYFRVCDIANTSQDVDAGRIDYTELRQAAEQAGIWAGVASYLKIVSDKVQQYRGTPLALPQEVLHAARVNGDEVNVRARFLRVPIMPHGAQLYTTQLTKTAARGDMEGAFRLTLLPPLATAAAVAYKLTGSDKGVW